MTDDRQHTIEITGIATTLAARRSPSRGLILRVESGSRKGSTLPIGLRPLSIGSDPGCDLVLDDPTISQRHAELQNRVEGVFVRDLGSTNGTFVGGTRVIEAMVRADASFSVGKTQLRLLDSGVPRLTPSTRARFGGLVGESTSMREVFAALELVSPTGATVLLEGPSGAGKELAARAIHDHSPRAGAPFVPFDCGSVSPELLTSALMGHKKGAFTGAIADRAGCFVEASQGTLFIDEIGELPLTSQTQLLRVLETSEVVPVGSDRGAKVDARVIAATHRDLSAMVERGAFRLDLFHRLAVVHIRLPGLSEHLEDLPALIRALYEGRGVDPGPISGPNLEALRAHPFEGNVRELRNIFERSWVLAGSGSLAFRDLRLWLAQPGTDRSEHAAFKVDASLPYKEAKEAVLQEFEASYLPRLMKLHGDSISGAARQAGLSRRHLRALLVKHGLVSSDE